MKSVLYSLFLTSSLGLFSQKNVLIDSRDNQEYRVTDILGKKWMLDNLNYFTDLSFDLSADLKEEHPNIKGRWYHMSEIESVCPKGWRLPDANDWIEYVEHLSNLKGASYKMKSHKESVSITKFHGKIDLFEKENPLDLIPAGIYQGLEFMSGGEEEVDFWINDIVSKKQPNENEYNLKYQPVSRIYTGTSHVHLYYKFIQIHSHEHHLDLEDPSTMRRFLVRCVCD